MAYFKRQPFHYDQADRSLSKDLQSLRHHLLLLFEIQKLLSLEQVSISLPTSEELTDMLADLIVVERELKILFKSSYEPADDIQSYSALADEILSRLENAMPDLVQCKIQFNEYKKFKESLYKNELKRAETYLSFFIGTCNEFSRKLGDIVFNDYYKRSLHLIGLTWL